MTPGPSSPPQMTILIQPGRRLTQLKGTCQPDVGARSRHPATSDPPNTIANPIAAQRAAAWIPGRASAAPTAAQNAAPGSAKAARVPVPCSHLLRPGGNAVMVVAALNPQAVEVLPYPLTAARPAAQRPRGEPHAHPAAATGRVASLTSWAVAHWPQITALRQVQTRHEPQLQS